MTTILHIQHEKLQAEKAARIWHSSGKHTWGSQWDKYAEILGKIISDYRKGNKSSFHRYDKNPISRPKNLTYDCACYEAETRGMDHPPPRVVYPQSQKCQTFEDLFECPNKKFMAC